MKKGLVGALSVMAGVAAGIAINRKVMAKQIEESEWKKNKFKNYYDMLNQWLMFKQEGKSLEKYFTDNNIKSISIYGMGEMGNRLYNELKDSNIKIKYAIDKFADNIYSDIKVCNINDDLEEVDAVIVTATFAFNDIKEQMEEKFDFPIISLEDVIYSI
jgi:lactate dehydrogenase-like 2-hydroxyacid dehydrogenase